MSLSQCTESVRILIAVATDVIKWNSGPPALKFQMEDYENKDRLQYLGYFHYSEHLNWAAQNLRLGSTWPAVGHSWAKWTTLFSEFKCFE